MTGSLGATGARLTKGWFTDLQVTNSITGSVTGTAATVTGATQASITSAANLTTIGTVTTGGLSTGAVIAGVTMTLGSDATGDMYYRNSSGVLTRIAPGAQGTVLGMGASSVPAWSVAGTGDMILASAQSVSGAKTFAQAALLINNPAATYAYTFQSAAIAAARTITLPLLTGNDTMVTAAFTQTLTNKTVTPRILSAASYTTDTGTSLNCDNLDQFIVTAQAGALKLNNPTGTPTDGQKLIVAITGTAARALTYDTQFEASTIALPTTTVTTARLNMGFIWRADTSKWVIIASC